MKKVILLFAAIALALGTAQAQQGFIHGNGDPRNLSPALTPNCGQARFYIDDTTEQMYTSAQGSPCVWTLGNTGVASVNGLAITPSSVNGVYSAANFGFTCDGAAHEPANSNAFAAIKTFAGALTAGQSAVVKFPPGSTCLYAATPTALPTANLTLDFTGVRMKFTGTGPMVDLSVAGSEVDAFNILGGIWQGNSGATYGFWQDSTTGALARSIFTPENVQDVTVAAFYLPNYELNLLTNLTASANLAVQAGVAQTTTPQYGVILGDPAVTNGFFSNNRVVNLTIEGETLLGVWCKRCQNQNHFFGTAENVTSSSGTVGVGLKDYTTVNDNWSSANTFSLDLEGNGVADADISGTSETFLSNISLGTFNIQGGGGAIVGGEYQTVALSGSREPWSLTNFYYNAEQTSGTVSGYACTDVVSGLWNRVGGLTLLSPPCAASSTAVSLAPAFANAVSNQKVDLYFPAAAGFSGKLLVTLSDTYQNADNAGALTKLIAFDEVGGSIYGLVSRYTEAMGGLAATYAIDDATWDSTNGRLRVRIACLIAANCSTSPNLVVNVTALSDSPASLLAAGALAETAVYTTDTTVYPTPLVSYPGLPTSAGSGGLFVCVDSTGHLYQKSTCP